MNSIFQEIVTKVAVDFSYPEIQDIQSAVSEMLERIKTRINERGVFSISRIEPCGSMAEKLAMWKCDHAPFMELEFNRWLFIELDFLAVLEAACDFHSHCPECYFVNTSPVTLQLLEQYYGGVPTLNDTQTGIVRESFVRETNYCLASCRCLEVKYPYQYPSKYTFVPASKCSKNEEDCDKCTVDRPTGTLRVRTSAEIGDDSYKNCSLIFHWTSKAKTLCTRDRWCFPKTEKMGYLTIHVDFLPAVELFQPKQHNSDVSACFSPGLVLNPTSSEYVHNCFLIPKRCAVCCHGDTWRRSGCLAEIDIIVNKMSDKHRKCYQVLKYIFEPIWRRRFLKFKLSSYYIKVLVLHHTRSCSGAVEDCAKCVFRVLDELLHAFKTHQLKSVHSEANLFKPYASHHLEGYSKRVSRLQEAMCFAVTESDSVCSFMNNIEKYFRRVLVYTD